MLTPCLMFNVMKNQFDYLDDPEWIARYGSVDVARPKEDFSKVINQTLDDISPVNPATHTRDDLIARVNDPDLTAGERKALADMMVRIPASERQAIPDDVLLGMLPSRYNQTNVDMQNLRQYYNSQILSDPAFKDAVVDETLKS